MIDAEIDKPLARRRQGIYVLITTDSEVCAMRDRGRPRGFDRGAALSRAMEIFWDKGYEGASLSNLTAAMGIGSTSLYAAFGSKEALFREAVQLYKDEEGSAIWSPIETAPTAFEAVRGFLLATARAFTRSKRPRGCLIVLSALHADETSLPVRRELRRLRANNVDALAARLQRGIEKGEISLQADPKAIASYYVTVQQGMSIQARDGADRATLERIAEAALAAWEPLTDASAVRTEDALERDRMARAVPPGHD